MNKANLKSYAPKARLDFIKAVTERANVLGISAAGVVPAEVRGDVALIDGREWPAKVAGQRDELIARIKRKGFEQTMDEVAYTWFNRFAALRYMEIHDYLGHGWRVLSSRDGGLPEILRHASEVTLPGLNPDRAREMQLAGNQDNELYKLLLVAQCNELSRVMPFLFERIDDETELLLPENLLRTDSIVAKLVQQVPEEDWQEIEVIGWLYQFYISEKKDQVIGKVVKSEDIPAATQLFTPNWIVQYLVQNSVGRLWLMAAPTSSLASQWPHYIHPAEQTPEVQAQLDALIQTRIREDGETLNPETITVLDPACGSGHILVVAYDVLKAIYLERGYQPRSIPRLILERNLYGLDIDDRAAQLAAFALLMKARADDRRLFHDPLRLNIVSLRQSNGLDLNELATNLAPFGLQRAPLKSLLQTFEYSKTFGSLIQIPEELSTHLSSMLPSLERALAEGDLYAQGAARDALPLVWQALVLAMHFDAVVANPPYMGGQYFDSRLKTLVDEAFSFAKGDLYSCFIARNLALAKPTGVVAMITIPNWMFLSTYERLRDWLLERATVETLVHNGRGVFGSDFGSCSFTFSPARIAEGKGTFFRLFDRQGSVASNEELAERFKKADPFFASSVEFEAIPGTPLAYWVSDQLRKVFVKNRALGDIAEVKQGLATADNNRFLRLWHEVPFDKIGVSCESRASARESKRKWFPHSKGGEFRKWYGNREWVVNWEMDGAELFAFRPRSVIRSPSLYFRECLTWTLISSAKTAFRLEPAGNIIGHKGPGIFATPEHLRRIGILLNSKVSESLLQILAPSIGFEVGQVSKIPVIDIDGVSDEPFSIAKEDWDAFETSWDFQRPLWLPSHGSSGSIYESWLSWADTSAKRIARMKELEERNNALLINAYSLGSELTPEVSDEHITLAKADREKDAQHLISYILGCVMGRYSLEEPGLQYAGAASLKFQSTKYGDRFPVDADGILPLAEGTWFDEDAASRTAEFLRVVWGQEKLEENLAWLAQGLGQKAGESPYESLSRYLVERFFKDHLQTYKKRPIYWLFSSGKQGAFKALIYLHRYHEGTLARMRAQYVVPLISKMVSRLEMLNSDLAGASSAAVRTKVQKQIESLRKKQVELLAFEEKLRHYADMRITLDLDDGVKVNYAKFGDLVAESKAITGGSDE